MLTRNKKNAILIILAVGLFGGLSVYAYLDYDKKEGAVAEAAQKNESSQVQNQSQPKLVVSETQLVEHVLSNDQEKVQAIIDKKVDLNQANTEGVYPLEAALVLDNVEMAEILLENGADPDVMTQSGKTIKEQVLAEGSEALKSLFSKY